MKEQNNKISLPPKVHRIISLLEKAGYEAYAVGGCIRDSILGRTPDDWDITTSALPLEVKKLFKRTVDTGLQHGTVTVIIEKEGFEVTTYRIDGEYEDARHPKEVEFTRNLTEDLKRRDFTINAMAYSESRGLVDEFGGLEDLEKQIIRCVGNPEERFLEDALRIMRAIRFSAQLGYQIEEETKRAIVQLTENLSKISVERIQVELLKLLLSPHPEYLKLAYELGITKVVFPEFDKMMQTSQNNPHHSYSVGEHVLAALGQVEADKILRLTMLFHDCGKPECKSTDADGIDHFYGHAERGEAITDKVLKRLRFDNKTIQMVTKLVYFHDYDMEPKAKSVRRAMNKIGQEAFPYLFFVKEADVMAQSEYRRIEKQEKLARVKEVYHKVCQANDCVTLKQLAVGGRELIDLGIQQGARVGEVLESLLDIVIEEPEKNQKEILLAEAEKFIEK